MADAKSIKNEHQGEFDVLKSDILTKVEQIYRQGGNISRFLKNQNYNNTETIMISYEFQAGSYIHEHNKDLDKYLKYTQQIINELIEFYPFDSILEAGVGEATTFKHIVDSNEIKCNNYYTFDISWSRLRVAKDFLKDTLGNQNLFVAELSSIPICDDAIDVVYTAHSVEPNRGHEKEILQELYRITKNYLLLFEPDYDYADDFGKARMNEYGYVKDLAKIAQELGYDVIKRKCLDYSLNPLNPTSVTIIKKSDVKTKFKGTLFQCPISKTELVDCGEIYFSPNPHLMYPVIHGIPCLLDSQAILGCKYELKGVSRVPCK